MPKMGFCIFTDGARATDVVAPKSDFKTAEEFLERAMLECDGYDWTNKLTAENVREGFCRWYPVAPEGCDIDGAATVLASQG